jgi:hypothetical protein
MPAVISNRVRIPVPVGDDTVVFICRRPTAAEQSEFLSARFQAKGRKVKSHLYDARQDLIYKVLVDMEGAEYETKAGERQPLNARTLLSDEDKGYWAGILGEQVTSWVDLIPVSWLSSAAMFFEDPAPEEAEGDRKN